MNAHTKTFDVETVRADFPILSKEVYGKKLVYLDNAASAQKPKQVLDRMVYAYEHEYANVHRGLHYLANAATEAFEHARETVRAFINAASTDEIIFTRNATEAMNLVAASLGRMVLQEGDEIILSVMEHHSNIVPWHFHRERHGAVIKWIPCDERGVLDLEAYEKLFTPKTKIVAISQMSNMLGSGEGWRGSIARFVDQYLINSQNLLYVTIFALLIIAFAYFYNSIAFDPIRQADQLRKQGGFIPGIRPGQQTESFLAKTVNRITLPGAMFVAVIAILPYIVLWVGNVSSFPFAGTTVLIAVGVALELMRQIDSQLMQRNYEGFLKQ
ncbi:MAG: aminotransferase class V-fold PLP-dependent enzyme [Actinobacteria bacterium]|nr:aminotransferase class V-fold PLP-dependent enzyme [Actinomycetota bacterium]